MATLTKNFENTLKEKQFKIYKDYITQAYKNPQELNDDIDPKYKVWDDIKWTDVKKDFMEKDMRSTFNGCNMQTWFIACHIGDDEDKLKEYHIGYEVTFSGELSIAAKNEYDAEEYARTALNDGHHNGDYPEDVDICSCSDSDNDLDADEYNEGDVL